MIKDGIYMDNDILSIDNGTWIPFIEYLKYLELSREYEDKKFEAIWGNNKSIYNDTRIVES